MFDVSRWQEIFDSIRTNMLRTILSGFTVALGLYIFIVLFGIGKGLQNSFSDNFTKDSQNLISIFANKTSIAYGGLQKNRSIFFKNDDYEEIVNYDKEKVEYSTPKLSAYMSVKYVNEGGNYQIIGTNDTEKQIENRKLLEGRYISPNDIKNKRYVAVIGRMIQRDLIKNGNAIGKNISVNGSIFTIIGVFSDESGDWEERTISVPISTLQQMKKGSDTINSISLTYNPNMNPEQAIEYGNQLKNNLKKKHNISPDDENAIIVRNNAQNLSDTFEFMLVLAVIVGFIGFGTLLAGIIGISNIMIYIVKERTQEIGIRKAIGASPKDIISLILQESIFITVISGLLGVFSGVLTLKLIGNSLEAYFIKSPNIGLGLVLIAFICLVLSGIIAGFVPAYRASKIKPIEALRTE